MKCLSVKKISFISFLSIALSCFGVFCLCRPVSAYNFEYSGTMSLDSAGIEYFDANLSASVLNTAQVGPSSNIVNDQIRFTFARGNNDGSVSLRKFYAYHNPSDGDGYIPANSIIHFSIHFSGQAAADGFTYNNLWGGLTYNNGSSAYMASIIGHNCSITSERVVNNNGTTSNVSREAVCDFWLYANDSISISGIGISGSVYAARPVSVDFPRYVDYVHLKEELTSNDIDRLSNNITSAIADLETAVEGSGGATPAQIQNAAETAIENALDDEKEQYEDQAEENETTINSDSSAAQSTATSLLGVVGQFISTLTSAQPTNCNLNGNLIPHLPLGNLDLCQNSPPAAITVLGSLVLIAFVVPLAYHTVKRMLSLIGSFQS